MSADTPGQPGATRPDRSPPARDPAATDDLLGTFPAGVRLISIRRTVVAEHADDYRTAWARLRDAIVEAGGKAWLFHAAGHAEDHLEFLESRELGRILANEAISTMLQQLENEFGPGTVELWNDAPLP